MKLSFANFKKAIRFSLKGRASRSEFWSFFCGICLLFLLYLALLTALSVVPWGRDLILPVAIIFGFGFMFLGFVNIFVMVRRLHDAGWPGWPVGILFFTTLFCVQFPAGSSFGVVSTLVNLLVFAWVLFLCSKKSEPTENKYGAPSE